MDYQVSHGMTLEVVTIRLDIAHITQFSFLPGTALMWLSSRYLWPTLSVFFIVDHFQQILWSNAQDIATQFPDDQKDEYVAAAVTLRVPYWDWSTSATMPAVVNEPEIDINTPDGYHSVVNPLYNYTFHPQPSPQDFPRDDVVSYFGHDRILLLHF